MAVRLVGFLLVVSMVAFIRAAPASAAERWVTFAARVCDDYSQITGNRARNNIMESLKDLGANTPYGTKLPDGRIIANEVDPAIEYEFQPPPGCRPLAGWKFKLGTGYQTKADPGVWGSLSRVTNPYTDTNITTSATAALYDRYHNRVTVGGEGVDIAGATTLELTSDQREQSSKGQALWLQGGVPGTPITGDPNLYGFAALRCATDNLNGDNVEFIAYPTGGVNHVFCFAYYVSPAPKPGKIVVTKRLAPDNLPDDFPKQTFRFTGNISYEKDNQGVGFFNLTAGPRASGSVTFERAAGTQWTFQEEAPTTGFVASTPTCTSTPAAGGAVSGVTINGRAVAVDLAAGDTVRCTFVNTVQRPPVGQLLLRKVTKNSIGEFRLDADEVDGPDSATRTIKTEVEDIAHDAPLITRLVPGNYRVTERIPDSDAGTWTLDNVFCNGGPRDVIDGDHVIVAVPSTGGQSCTFTNRFKHAGAISISKTTLGGVATTRFQIRPARANTRSSTSSSRRPASLASGWMPRATVRRRSRSASTRSRRPPPPKTASAASGASCASSATAAPSTARKGASSCASRPATPRSTATSSTSSCDPSRRNRRRSRPSPRRRLRLRRFRQAVSRRPRRATWPSCASPRARRSAG